MTDSLGHLSDEALKKKYDEAMRTGDKGMVNMCYAEAKERDDFQLEEC